MVAADIDAWLVRREVVVMACEVDLSLAGS